MCSKATELQEKELGFDPSVDQPEVPASERKKELSQVSSSSVPGAALGLRLHQPVS